MFQCWTSVCGHVCQRDVGSWSIACAVGGWWLQRGRSALSEACYHSRSSVVKELLFRGAAFGLIDKVSSIGAGVHWSLCLRPVGGQDDSVSVHSPVVCIPMYCKPLAACMAAAAATVSCCCCCCGGGGGCYNNNCCRRRSCRCWLLSVCVSPSPSSLRPQLCVFVL